MLKIWENVLSKGEITVFGGDLNIDRLPSNNPSSRPELKRLIEALVEFQTKHNVGQLNHKATRHRMNQRSTLIDLFLSNCPEKCTKIVNGTNTTSEHDFVTMTLTKEKVIKSPQFFESRNTKHLNYATLEPKN